MATPQKASTSSAEKNKHDSKNNSDTGTKNSGSIFVPRKQSTTKSTIPLSAMDNKSVVTSSLSSKPNSSRAMTTSTKTTKKNEQTVTIAHTNSDCSLKTMKMNEQLVTISDSNCESIKIGCTTNLSPIMAGRKIVSHNLGVNPNSSSERRETEYVGNLIEKIGQTVIPTITEINIEQLASCNKNSDCTTNWLPQMDDIEIDLPSFNGATTTDREMKMNEEMAKTETYIQNVLYSKGVRRQRRLPVFEEICPSDLFPEYCED